MRSVPALLLQFFSSCPVVLRGKSPDGSITGRVTDSINAVIADVKVAAISVGIDKCYEGASNASGQYYLANLPLGSYRIEIEKIDFQKFVKPGVEFPLSDVISLIFSLEDGQAAQSVAVGSGAPLVETTIGKIS